MNKKIIVLGVTGGIAAYKSAQLASNLSKSGYDVHVIMTENATEFITPLTFEVLTNNKVIVDTFDRQFDYNVNHVALAKKANLFVVAPATANIIAKFAQGIADDMLTTSYLAFICPVLVAPAMNSAMLNHPATKRNIATMRADGVNFIEPETGYLACGDVGSGRLAEVANIEAEIANLLATSQNLSGKKVVITAGPTLEALDPVRFISNHSSGKMGYALALAARNQGADVILISGPTNLQIPSHVKAIQVTSAAEMYEASLNQLDYDFFIAAAAVSDYRPTIVANQKLKKADLATSWQIDLTENVDVVKAVAKNKLPSQKVVAFAMETTDLLANAQAKLKAKQVDMVVANDLKIPGAGFSGDTNQVVLVTATEASSLPLMSKNEVAVKIINKMMELL